MAFIRVKVAKAFSRGQFAKNCLMRVEKTKTVLLIRGKGIDANTAGRKKLNTQGGNFKKFSEIQLLLDANNFSEDIMQSAYYNILFTV